MNLRKLGPARILRPPLDAHQALEQLAKRDVVKHFSPGRYEGKRANELIQHLYRYCERKLNRFVIQLASRDAVEFLLSQYDQASLILHNKDITDSDEATEWESIEGTYRRAIKHIVELMCLRYPEESFRAKREDAMPLMYGAVAAAETMATLAEHSERLHSIFPDSFEVLLHASDTDGLITLTASGAASGFDRRFFDRIVRDRESRKDYVGFPQYDVDTACHLKFLDPAFEESFGTKYSVFLKLIKHLVDTSIVHGRGFDTPFLHRAKILDGFQNEVGSRALVSTILSGFTVDPANMEVEDRRLWKPKQEHRALWRGFFQFPHPIGEHICFSREMARENLLQLVNRVCYKRLPAEWLNPTVNVALTALSQAAGTWFEEIVQRNIYSAGIEGSRYRRSLGTGASRITIPDEVGEIDFLGWNAAANHLVVLEDKMTFSGLEASHWRDDIHEFVSRKNSYALRFRRKLDWVFKQREQIARALGKPKPTGIHAAMLTLYPCIARDFIKDFECVSLTEFMLDFKQVQIWPYPSWLKS